MERASRNWINQRATRESAMPFTETAKRQIAKRKFLAEQEQYAWEEHFAEWFGDWGDTLEKLTARLDSLIFCSPAQTPYRKQRFPNANTSGSASRAASCTCVGER
jgi:hypothetical protein